ncbi:MAG: stage III sporulation protein AG [Oscillospiraceae bacterium]|nr:stage III sporulation protein AG [Oscillospiraceae bacterium]
MRFQWKKPEAEQVWKLLEKYKYVLIILAAGLILLLWPTGEKEKQSESADHSVPEEFDLAALEEKLSQTLSQVEGAGKVTVALTVKSGMEQVPVTDRSTSVTERGNSLEEKTVVINTGSGQETVVRVQRYPQFQGAVVVSQGGDRADVRLLLTQAVSALTGLGADRITVCKGG